MAVTALMKFTQASGATDSPGVAVVGTLSGVVLNDRVTITNGDNSNVVSWSIDLLHAPSDSALVPGVLDAQVSNTPIAYFDPDKPGCYRCKISVSDSFGHTDVDIRNFAIPNYKGIIVPPYQMNPVPIALALKPEELNFGSQTAGWLGTRTTRMHDQFFYTYMNKAFKLVDATPFAAALDEADVYLVKTATIGAASAFNLPSSARYGFPFCVRDYEGAAGSYNITVNLPGGHTFDDGSTSKTINTPNGYVVVTRVSSTSWVVLDSSVSLDLSLTDVATTPYNATSTEGSVHLVKTATIGGPSVFNLPASARVGQVFTVTDDEESAYSNVITVNLPAGHFFMDGSSSRTIWANGGSLRLVRTGATSWRLLEETSTDEFVPIMGAEFSTDLLGYQRVAATVLDTDRFPPNAVYVLEMVLEVNNVARTAQARLWNVTLGAEVATLTSTSLTPETKSVDLEKTTDLAAGSNIYEAQLKMDGGALPDTVTMSSAHFRVVYSKSAA